MPDKPRSREQEEWIRRRAYELWEAEGRPEARQEEHWRKAEEELEMMAAPQRNEGEGNKTAALAFDRNQTEFAQEGDVAGKTAAARAAVEGPEGAELAQAERKGRSRSRGEDPQLAQGSRAGPKRRA